MGRREEKKAKGRDGETAQEANRSEIEKERNRNSETEKDGEERPCEN